MKQQQNTNTMKKPFCKVCYDTGKPAEIYNNHFVKDIPGPKGVVICPTLLSLECRYCKQKGHTVSKCPIIAEKRSQKRFVKPVTILQKHDKKPVKKNTNRFDLLETDDDSPPEEESKDVQEDDTEDELKTLTRNPNSYASVLSREMRIRSPSTSPPRPNECHMPNGPPPGWHAHTPDGSPPPLNLIKPRSPSISPPPRIECEPLAPRRPITRTMNWADMEDSDDEDF